MRRAQIQGQIFVYILALFIVGLILYFGYNAIQDLTDRADLAAKIKFQTDIESYIKSLRGNYGSEKTIRLNVPGGFEKVCFADISFHFGNEMNDYPIIEESVKSGVQKNVFLFPPGTDAYYVGEMEVADNFKCFDVLAGRITIKLEGKGNSVEIS